MKSIPLWIRLLGGIAILAGTCVGLTFVPTGEVAYAPVDPIDLSGNVTGWVPLTIVNKPGSYTVTVRSRDGDSQPYPFTITKPGGRLPLQIHLPEYLTAISRGRTGAASLIGSSMTAMSCWSAVRPKGCSAGCWRCRPAPGAKRR